MKRILLYVILLFIVKASLWAVPQEKGWKAGTAKVIITPKESIWMGGYALRTKPAEGKLHDLWAKALFLEDATGKQALLITADLVGIPQKVSERIRDDLKATMGLSRSQIILNSSHTHSGPVLSESLTGIYPLDAVQQQKIDNYTNWLIDQIEELAGKAKKAVEPVTIYAQNGIARFQVNRRNNQEAKLTELTELKGPNDFAVPVLKIKNKRGKIETIVFGYACHATVLDGYDWSGDYPGFAQLELEKKYKGATAMFFQGAGGDQNPMPRRSVALARQFGQELAVAVERVLNENMRELAPRLATAYSEMDLELNPAPSRAELEELETTLTGYEKRWAERLVEKLDRGESLITSYPYPMLVWRLGDQLVLSLGGELLIDYQIRLKQIFGNDIFVLGYSNDVMSYIPSEKVLQEGGYEGKSSFRAFGMPSTWKPGLQRIIISEAAELAFQTGIPRTPELNDKMNTVMNDIPLNPKQKEKKSLVAKRYFSGFDLAHDTYNAISAAGDGRIYYVLSSQPHDVAGQMYRYDPRLDKTEFLADLNDICGEKDLKAIAQGKSHVRFYECDGKLWFATHVGYYEMIDGMECLPVHAPEGYQLYPGGHILSYDLKTEKFENHTVVPHGEGVLSMTMDTQRKQIYAITWPKGYLIHYDLNTGKLTDLGLVSANGEGGKVGEDYRVLCRSMFVDPRDGKVYYSTSEGEIFFYDPQTASLQNMKEVSLKMDYFGSYDPARPGNMGYNWRAIVWYPKENVAYGVHGNSGYLFRFDPREKKIEIVDRITSEPSKKSGMFDQFSYGYLGFDLGKDQETLYYLTGGPVYLDGKRVKGVNEIAMGAARGLENLHLVTYHLPSGKYTDHGPVFYEDGSVPTYVNSIAVDKDGNVYTLARFKHKEKIVEDLVKISAGQ
ncbi:MAG: neutral/alkaline non-lysosomal ceramidase N-terminal domain-containing protein [Mangrovibacterium sp.]